MRDSISIQTGPLSTYQVSRREHQAHMRGIKHGIPRLLARLEAMNAQRRGAPGFIIHHTPREYVRVVREDFQTDLYTVLDGGDVRSYYSRGGRLSVSEWMEMTVYRGDPPSGYPITMHDVYVSGRVTYKTGNPNRNNAWQEFERALTARELGVVEAKAPVGFSFRISDPYGVNFPGVMCYKHLDGVDLDLSLRTGSGDLANWALWETAKFFSRIDGRGLLLEDSDRLGNFFIEHGDTFIFRFLDLERMHRPVPYPAQLKAEMLMKFIRKAMEVTRKLSVDFMTPDKVEEFVAVCLNPRSRAATLVYQMVESEGLLS